jgi:hypothetical protein
VLVDHTEGTERYKSVWTIDIEVVTIYTEHRYPLTAYEAVPPPRAVYGDMLKALIIVLSMESIVSLQRISRFFREVTGGLVSPCRATVERMIKGLRELYKCPWAGEFADFYKGMNDRKNVDLGRGVSKCDASALHSYSAQYDALLERGYEILETMNANSFGKNELC